VERDKGWGTRGERKEKQTVNWRGRRRLKGSGGRAEGSGKEDRTEKPLMKRRRLFRASEMIENQDRERPRTIDHHKAGRKKFC